MKDSQAAKVEISLGVAKLKLAQQLMDEARDHFLNGGLPADNPEISQIDAFAHAANHLRKLTGKAVRVSAEIDNTQ